MVDTASIERQLGDATLAPSALFALALQALDAGLFERIVERVEQAIAAGARDARLYQVLGLAYRELLRGAEAMRAFEQAATLAPRDPLIGHGLARSTWEAGLPAVARYDAVLQLTPNDPGVLLGRMAALVSEGRGPAAVAALARLLAENPGWHQGHSAYARLVGAAKLPIDGTATVRAALNRYPDDPSLWQLLLRMLIDARRYAEVVGAARAAGARFGADAEWWRAEAIALSESGEAAAAQRLLDRLPASTIAAGLIHPIRNLMRLGRYDEAQALAERPFPMPDEAELWPYRALLWRLRGDARWEWLEGDARLIGVYDVGLSDREIAALADVLRAIHRGSGELTDQSVRGGTQTDGNVLARAEPEIVALRKALLEAVAAHVAQLPPPVTGHPTLVEQRAPQRIAGSWSVRLSDAGFHVDHVHPMGWLSSAFYVALPAIGGAEDKSGWLAFGEARDLLPDLDGFRFVEPKPGRLALFPSTMWHGTRPFAAGERMTVAFDIARP